MKMSDSSRSYRKATRIRKMVSRHLAAKRSQDVTTALAIGDLEKALAQFREHQTDSVRLRKSIERTIPKEVRPYELRRLLHSLDAFIGEIALTVGAIRQAYKQQENLRGP